MMVPAGRVGVVSEGGGSLLCIIQVSTSKYAPPNRKVLDSVQLVSDPLLLGVRAALVDFGKYAL